MDTKITRYAEIEPYLTKDGSVIRELMHPSQQGNRNQSLAEATVPSGGVTFLHRHLTSEELYHVTQGAGLVTVGGTDFPVEEGTTICIPAGTPHRIQNEGETELKILCCCSPAYRHDDTELL